VAGDVNDLRREVQCLLAGGFLFADAAGFVAVPAVVTHHLESLVGNVLGDGRDGLARREHLEVTLGLGVVLGTVDARGGGGVVGNSFSLRRACG